MEILPIYHTGLQELHGINVLTNTDLKYFVFFKS